MASPSFQTFSTINTIHNRDFEEIGLSSQARLNPHIAYGPVQERGCKDSIYFIVFSLFWVGLIFVAGIAEKTGDPKRLLSPFDPNGTQCGYGVAADYPYLFFNLQKENSYDKVYACIKECPKEDSIQVECILNQKVTDCSKLISYASKPHVNICFPEDEQFQENDDVKNNASDGGVEEWMSNLKTTWPVSVAVAFITFGLSLFFFFLMRQFAGIVVWFLICGYFFLIISLGLYCILNSMNRTIVREEQYPYQTEEYQPGFIAGWLILIVAAIGIAMVFCCYKNIKRAIATIKIASAFTREVWQSFLVPVAMFILISLFYAFWVTVQINIYTSAEVRPSQYSPFGYIVLQPWVQGASIFYIFGLFWNVEFLKGMCQLIISSCVAFWYFSHRPNSSLQNNIVYISIKRAFSNHIGSVCFGSLILSSVKLIHLLARTEAKKARASLNNNSGCNRNRNRDEEGRNNQQNVNLIVYFLLQCLVCILRQVEGLVKFLSTNAYIMIGLSGQNFCDSAKQAFFLVFRNYAQFQITRGLGQIIVFFGVLFISSISCFFGYCFITYNPEYSENIYSPVVPTILFVLISLTISYAFMCVYDMAIDTVFMCLSSDKELNHGDPQSCPEILRQFEIAYL